MLHLRRDQRKKLSGASVKTKSGNKSPNDYRKGEHQQAVCMDAMVDEEKKKLPKAVYVHCEEMTAKDVWKLIDWLYEAGKWMEE